MEEYIPHLLGGLSLIAVVVFSLADGALSEFSWMKLEARLGDREKLKRFSKEERAIALSVKVLTVFFTVTFAVAVIYAVGRSFTEGGFVPYAVAGSIVATGMALCDMVPDLLGRRNPESVLAWLLPLLRAIEKPARPLVGLLSSITEILARLLGFPKDDTSAEHIEEELMSAITEGKHEGVFTDGEDRMLKSILEFKDVQISEVMTPRTDMFAFQADMPVAEAVRLGFEKGHSRIPVYQENLDDIVGVLYIKDLLGLWGDPSTAEKRVRDCVRKAYFVPETKDVSELLVELKREKIYLAVVMDEYGGTAGITTFEDIVEEIVGDIEDEHDQAAPETFEKVDEHTAVVDARLHVDELNERMGTAIPEDDSYETVSGFLFAQTGKIPEIDETVTFENVTFTVLKADERRIERVRVVIAEAAHE